MKILQVNKFLYPKSGTETYIFGLSNILEKNNHKVFYFSQKNEKNIPNNEEKYFIDNIELNKFYWKSISGLYRIFWYKKAAKNIEKLIKEKKPDIVHIHNIYHHLSPAILPTIKKFRIPIVMSIHDFKLVNPEYTLWIKKNRNQKSILSKFLMHLEFNLHRLLKVYKKNIDLFIAPSEFVRNQLIKNGYDKRKIVILPHFIDLEKYKPQESESENYILYFGRLDYSKGIDILIKAFNKIENKCLKLKIVGSGPELENLKKIKNDNIEFCGQKNKNELIKIIQKSLFTVFPSRVHETFGLTVLESFACSKPVVATNAGAYTELIENGKNGLFFRFDDEKKLTQIIDNLSKNKKELTQLGQNARIKAENYDQRKYYDNIIGIYQKLIR